MAAEAESAAAPATVAARPPRPHDPSEQELARHAAFIAGISDPIWNRLGPRG
jgi:DNA polymerase-3 subunit epsilon